ncbi:glycosyltransferase family 2 protein [Floricoccus penangensis]|uniref:Glucosyl transferase family 2 n=1 Tax=Floricoccus penangensis TaxID=1859475 RepID=A0A9Q5NZY1_9LACT|nr:glycosyltransferase family 2 protein [Floricoccus penangensis]OFI46307.1 glucosyl transferase family 2 [Floricoccus penangensis]URZ87033.1 glycosyltransferase family 2 protein [Floricoccus penangensis]
MKLSVIVPCYNEEESIPLFFAEMQKVNEGLPLDFEYIFVNDGSKDKTLDILRDLAKENNNVHYISFSRNFGKESALYAGLENATGDYVTVMDVDLQDPPELLIEMFEKIQDPDIDCVGCRRVSRTGEPPIRSFFARMFYKIINKIGQTEMVDGARDFRLMTRQMVDAILEVREYNRFSKGIFTWVGFNTIYLEYENRERVAGETSWNFWSLLKYSLEGIINFSEAPLNIATYGGMLSVFISIVGAIFIVIRTLVFGDSTNGWPSLVIIILFCSGINLLMLGIIGKYISKIFLETKSRPIYVVRETEKDLKKLTIMK